MHSGTLPLSHCKMLRISGESVSNHHGQINDSNTKQEDARRCKKIMHISKWDLLIYTPVQTQPRQGKVNSVKHALRNAIVVSLQDAQNQRGKRFKSSRANQRLKQKDHAYLIISLNVICLITHWSKLNQDKVKIVKHALRNATVVSLQDAQNQRGKAFQIITGKSTTQTPSKKMQEDHAYLEMGFDHLHTGANSTKTR